jgi:DNA-binding Lrp family transcriptional regulator
LQALEELGTKVSTRELSERLEKPARTIRYRIKKMKDKGIIHKSKVQTHERKLGLAEYILIVTSSPGKEEILEKVLEEIIAFYFYGPTYGKFEGYFIYTVYPINTPRLIPDLAEELKKRGLIEEYYLFDVVDYKRNEARLAEVSSWDWDKWTKLLPKIMSRTKKLKLDLEENPKTVSFDEKDIMIILNKVKNPKITLRELGDILGLSQPQIHNRVKRLKESGIIRGHKLSLNPFDSAMKINCCFRSNDAKKILLWFDKLPYYHQFTLESGTHFCAEVYLPSTETSSYLQSLRFLRQYTDEMFVQFIVGGTHKGYDHLVDIFDKETGSWNLPYAEFVKILDEITNQ